MRGVKEIKMPTQENLISCVINAKKHVKTQALYVLEQHAIKANLIIPGSQIRARISGTNCILH